MPAHYVANVEEVAEGKPLLVQVRNLSIGIYRIGDEFYAIHNHCPHQGAELCKGPVCGTTLPSDVYEYEYGRHGEIVRCPWHGWEFDIKTGVSLFDERVRAKTFQVEVNEGKIAVVI